MVVGLDIGSRLLVALIVGVLAWLIVEWWGYRSAGKRQ